MFIGALTAFINSLIFNLLLPSILGVVLAGVVSGATLLDPLYAGERIETSWQLLKVILIFQTLHTVITAPLAGGLTGFLRSRINSRWYYVAGIALSLGFHYLLSAGFAVVYSFLSSAFTTASLMSIMFIIATFSAPLIGLISVFAIRRWAK